MDYRVYEELRAKVDAFSENRSETWFVLFSKSGFTPALETAAEQDGHLLLVTLKELLD